MMAGLVLKLAAHEKLVINGAVLQNGHRGSSLRIEGENVRVLRCRDALRPDEVDTPVKHLYFALQLMITGDIAVRDGKPVLVREIEKIRAVFDRVDDGVSEAIQIAFQAGNYYSALCKMKQLLAIEEVLMHHHRSNQSLDKDCCQKVA